MARQRLHNQYCHFSTRDTEASIGATEIEILYKRQGRRRFSDTVPGMR